MFPQNILVTGANRGIGLEFVKQLLKYSPKNIIATARQPDQAKELKEIAAAEPIVKLIKLDVQDEKSVVEARQRTEEIVGGDGLNALINNAAIYTQCPSIHNVSVEGMVSSYRCNVIGPAIMCREFLPMLKKASSKNTSNTLNWKSAAIINISSDSGSVTETNSMEFQTYNYGPSKAALNMLTKMMSMELKPSGILVVAIHPGWVKTDMTGPEAQITTEESVQGILKILPSFGDMNTGKLYEYTGREMAA